MKRSAQVIFSLVLLAFVFLVPAALAGDDSASDDLRDAKQELSEVKEAAKKELEAKRAEIKEQARLNREEIVAKRVEAREEVRTRREEYKEKLAQIRDERKQKAVERIDGNIVKINTKWTDNWTDRLGRMTEILAKIDARADELSGNGADVSAVLTAIADAESAIVLAQASVTEQAGKDYVLEIGEEENLGDAVSGTMEQFRTDLKSVRDKVKNAKDAVSSALEALRALSTIEN